MPELQYGTSSFDRQRGNFPSIPVINMIAEEEPTEPHVALISRPGLENTTVDFGSEAIVSLFKVDGVLSGGLFGASLANPTGHLYQGPTNTEKLVNGDFSNGTTNWTNTGTGSGSGSIVGGRMRVTKTGASLAYVYQTFTTVPGKQYRITGEGFDGTAGTNLATFGVGTTVGGSDLVSNAHETNGIFDTTFTATTTSATLRLVNASTTGTYTEFANMSVTELGGTLGSITGDGTPISMAGFEDRLFITAGGDVYEWNGSTLSTVTLPDGFEVSSLCVGASRLIVVKKDTGRFYWSDVLTDTVNALSFATAEQSPDRVKQVLYLGDTLILLGAETVEFWPVNTDSDLPFTPLVGQTYQVGIRDTGCACIWNGNLAWITNRNQICVSSPDNFASTPSLEEKLTNSTTAKLWTFLLDGVEYLAVRMDTDTWVFSSRTSQWSQFESDSQTNWLPQCYADGYFGTSLDGKLAQWSADYSDFDGTLERRFRAGMPIDSGTLPLFSVLLRTNSGYAPSDPCTVQLRTSKDGGQNWSSWKDKTLGSNGQYTHIVRWRALGFFSYPTVLLEIRVTDQVPFRVSNLVANETYAAT